MDTILVCFLHFLCALEYVLLKCVYQNRDTGEHQTAHLSNRSSYYLVLSSSRILCQRLLKSPPIAVKCSLYQLPTRPVAMDIIWDCILCPDARKFSANVYPLGRDGKPNLRLE
uniref:Secreted protein n=1 Tax=Glossina pallidipes TaxID=7398 RepID=A0A1A9ZUE3_GLOPL